MVAVYARQSVDKKDSISIESQIQKGFAFVDKNDEVATYKDKGFSGKNTERPDFKRLTEDINSGIIKKVIVYKIDRISRNLLDFANIMEMFTKHNVEFVSVSEQFDTSTPMGKAMLYIVMIFAQLERETIQQRILDNYYSRGEQGYYLGGRRPFGFDKERTNLNGKNTWKFKPIPEQTAVLKEMFDLYANTNISLEGLGRKFTEQKLFGGRIFNNVFVGRKLRNPAYVKANADVYLYLQSKGATMNNPIEDYIGVNGVAVYGGNAGKTKTDYSDLEGKFASLSLHEGVIEPNIWLACQYKLEKNKQITNSGAGTHSWLSGLIRCSKCGSPVYINNAPENRNYARCSGKRKFICEGLRAYRAEAVEEVIEKALIEHLKANKIKQKDVNNIQGTEESNDIKIKLAKIKKAITNLVKRVADGNANAVKYLNEAIDDYEKEKQSLTLRLQGIYKKQTKKNLPAQEDIYNIINNWDKMNFDSKKKIARNTIKQIVLTDEDINVEFI